VFSGESICFPKESRERVVNAGASPPATPPPVRLSQRKSEPTRLCSEVILGNSILSLLCSNQNENGCTQPYERNGPGPGFFNGQHVVDGPARTTMSR
jgi:hypothetical protein